MARSVRSPSRVWVAPPEWPPAPEAFEPPHGWQPDPGWPPAPAGHKFWQRTPAGRRRIAVRLAIALPLLALLLGGCGVLAFYFPPDFPPGDVYSLTVTNSASVPLEVFNCDDNDNCTHGWDQATLQSGAQAQFNEDQYTPTLVGVSDPTTHRLIGCLTPPHAPNAVDLVGDPTMFTTHASTTCAGLGSVVSFYDPSS